MPPPLEPERVVVRDLADDGAIAAALRERFDADPTIITVADPSIRLTQALLAAGARGVIDRDRTLPDIETAVAAVAAGFIVTVPQPAPVTAAGAESLTPRERDVLALLARGLSNKSIGTRLALTENTVKFHVAAIFSKLDATSRTEAVTNGVRRGLIML